MTKFVKLKNSYGDSVAINISNITMITEVDENVTSIGFAGDDNNYVTIESSLESVLEAIWEAK